MDEQQFVQLLESLLQRKSVFFTRICENKTSGRRCISGGNMPVWIV